MIRVAVDAMGGDHAPALVVRGAEAASTEGIAEVILVGDENVIRPFLKNPSGLEIVHTPSFVEMKESPSAALRRKKDCSVNKAFSLLKSGDVQGVVSAGNSGAALAFAIFTLGRLQGVDRPAIATIHPNVKGGFSLLLDAGGTVDCRPAHLAQFAIMGDVFARHALSMDNPRIGVLSNGQEETKGNDLTRETHAILKSVNLNYIGYIEGNDLYNGTADVVVTDGFVGNVALKISEGVAEAITGYLKERVSGSMRSKVGYLLLSQVFKNLVRMVDYSEYGGAPLLGVDGACIICHGKSNEKAIKNAVSQVKRFASSNVIERMKDAMQDYTGLRTKEQ